MVKYLLVSTLFLVSCATNNRYVTNEQLHFRIKVHCQNEAYRKLKPPYKFNKDFEACMSDFGYILDWQDTRDDWKW